MANALAVSSVATQPFQFFCSERWEWKSIIEYASFAYDDIEDPSAIPPSLEQMAEFLNDFYGVELLYRALLRDDVMLFSEGDVKRAIEESIAEGVVDNMEEYFDMLMEEGQTFDLATDFGRMFVSDLKYALDTAHLFYSEFGASYWDRLVERVQKPKLHNHPIQGVW